jgi:hypothetical protein
MEHRVGAMRLHLPRTSHVSTGLLQHVSMLRYSHFESAGDTPKCQPCYGIDVFFELHETAPRALEGREKNLEA